MRIPALRGIRTSMCSTNEVAGEGIVRNAFGAFPQARSWKIPESTVS
jgi:hypothetical protein